MRGGFLKWNYPDLCFAFLMINDGFNDYDYDSQARSAVHIIIVVTDKNLSELIAFEDAVALVCC